MWTKVLQELNLNEFDKKNVNEFFKSRTKTGYLNVSQLLYNYGHKIDSIECLREGLRNFKTYNSLKVQLAMQLLEKGLSADATEILKDINDEMDPKVIRISFHSYILEENLAQSMHLAKLIKSSLNQYTELDRILADRLNKKGLSSAKSFLIKSYKKRFIDFEPNSHEFFDGVAKLNQVSNFNLSYTDKVIKDGAEYSFTIELDELSRILSSESVFLDSSLSSPFINAIKGMKDSEFELAIKVFDSITDDVGATNLIDGLRNQIKFCKKGAKLQVPDSSSRRSDNKEGLSFENQNKIKLLESFISKLDAKV